MKPYFESVFLSCDTFRVKTLVTSTMEHVIEVHPHWHQEVEVLYYMQGCALQQVNDVFFTAQPGDIVVIGQDQLHATYTVGKSNCRILVVQFDAAALFARDAAPSINEYDTGNIFRNPIGTDDECGKQILQCIMEIEREMDERQAAHEQLVRAALLRFTGLLIRFRCYTQSAATPENIIRVHAMLEKTFRLVDLAFAEEITLSQGALASNLSVTHFCRLFKKTTGMTFHDYLTFYRINRAEQMLLASSRRLTDIAFECGFGSLSAFIRNFKKYKKCTPSRYMQEAE